MPRDTHHICIHSLHSCPLPSAPALPQALASLNFMSLITKGGLGQVKDLLSYHILNTSTPLLKDPVSGTLAYTLAHTSRATRWHWQGGASWQTGLV